MHAESWRTAYRGMLPDEYLDGPIDDERLHFWKARMAQLDPARSRVLTGFACIVLDVDPMWGARRRFYERRAGRVEDTTSIEVVPGVHVAEVRHAWPGC